MVVLYSLLWVLAAAGMVLFALIGWARPWAECWLWMVVLEDLITNPR